MTNLKYAIEGVLFAAGEPVKAANLAVALNEDLDKVNQAVEQLKEEYNRDSRGFTIIDIDEGYQICSRPVYYAYIQEILGEQRRQALSNAAMETLAIIAYKQPVTRSGIEYVRGINSDGSVNRLLERGLIEEAGRLDAPGRPILYVTTQNFLRCFGLSTLKDLPPVRLGAALQSEEGADISETQEAGMLSEDSKIADAEVAPETAKTAGKTEDTQAMGFAADQEADGSTEDIAREAEVQTD